MTDKPLTTRLSELRQARTIAALLVKNASESEPEYVDAVLSFIAVDLIGRFSLIGGATNG